MLQLYTSLSCTSKYQACPEIAPRQVDQLLQPRAIHGLGQKGIILSLGSPGVWGAWAFYKQVFVTELNVESSCLLNLEAAIQVYDDTLHVCYPKGA